MIPMYRVRIQYQNYYPEKLVSFFFFDLWRPLYKEGHQGGGYSAVSRHTAEQAWDLIEEYIKEKQMPVNTQVAYQYTRGVTIIE